MRITNYAHVPDSLPFLGGDDEGDGERTMQRRALAARLERTFLSATFRTEASCGTVECTSRGCRPVPGSRTGDGGAPLPGSDEAAVSGARTGDGGTPRPGSDEAEPLEHRDNGIDSLRNLARMAEEAGPPWDAGAGIRAQGSGSRHRGSSFPAEFAEFVDRFWSHEDMADRYYRTAVLRRPFDVDVLIRYAEFSWQRKRNHMQAETLFGQALEEEPQNVSALASYALFLWESESATQGG